MDRIIKKVEETSCQWPGLEHILQAALRWQSKNAKGPTDKQFGEMVKDCGDANPGRWESFTEWQRAIILCGEWERRMYDAPEPEVPDHEVDRVDFYVKTTDGRYVPWIPTEEQKVMMNLIVPEPVEGNNLASILENRITEYSEWLSENLSRSSRNEELLPRLKWDKTNRKPFTYGDFYRLGKKDGAK